MRRAVQAQLAAPVRRWRGRGHPRAAARVELRDRSRHAVLDAAAPPEQHGKPIRNKATIGRGAPPAEVPTLRAVSVRHRVQLPRANPRVAQLHEHRDMDAFAVFPHMCSSLQTMTFEVASPSGRREGFEGQWDFDHQRSTRTNSACAPPVTLTPATTKTRTSHHRRGSTLDEMAFSALHQDGEARRHCGESGAG